MAIVSSDPSAGVGTRPGGETFSKEVSHWLRRVKFLPFQDTGFSGGVKTRLITRVRGDRP